MPKVSIIVPAYNAETSIGRCIQSILDQTYKDFELIVIDDGSTDGTAGIIEEFASKDSRIDAVHKDNTGVSDTRNLALNRAAGEYVQFVDSDDWITADATGQFVHAMEDNPTCDMVISDFYRVVGERMSVKGDIEEEKLITRLEYAQAMMRNPADFYYGVLWNKFFRRSIIEDNDLRMDVKLNWAEDFIFNMEYILHADRIYVLKAPLYYYVRTKGSLAMQGGASIAKTVRMKLNVIEYYSSFYKDIYTPGGYYLRSPAIYSFLLNFAKDGGVNPVAPGRKMGQDRIDVHFAKEMEQNLYVTNFYEDRLLDHEMVRIISGTELDRKDVEILLYLKLAGGTASVNEVRNFTGFSARIVSGSIQKLIRKEIVEKVKEPKTSKAKKRWAQGEDLEPHGEDNLNKVLNEAEKNEGVKTEKTQKPSLRIRFGAASSEIREKLDHAFRDIDEIQLRDFSEREKCSYRKYCGIASQNIRKVLAQKELN